MFSGWTCPARECSQARHLLPHRKMIEFMRCDDQPDGSLAVILPQAVSHGAGSKGRARDPGILKAAFEQMGDLMKKSVALLRCPELQVLSLPRQRLARDVLLPEQGAPDDRALWRWKRLLFGLSRRSQAAPPFRKTAQGGREFPGTGMEQTVEFLPVLLHFFFVPLQLQQAGPQ